MTLNYDKQIIYKISLKMKSFIMTALVVLSVAITCARKGTTLTPKLVNEMSQMLEIHFIFATVEHPQTMGVIERSHSSLKTYLKVYDHSSTNSWHKHVQFFCFCAQHNFSPTDWLNAIASFPWPTTANCLGFTLSE